MHSKPPEILLPPITPTPNIESHFDNLAQALQEKTPQQIKSCLDSLLSWGVLIDMTQLASIQKLHAILFLALKQLVKSNALTLNQLQDYFLRLEQERIKPLLIKSLSLPMQSNYYKLQGDMYAGHSDLRGVLLAASAYNKSLVINDKPDDRQTLIILALQFSLRLLMLNTPELKETKGAACQTVVAEQEIHTLFKQKHSAPFQLVFCKKNLSTPGYWLLALQTYDLDIMVEPLTKYHSLNSIINSHLAPLQQASDWKTLGSIPQQVVLHHIEKLGHYIRLNHWLQTWWLQAKLMLNDLCKLQQYEWIQDFYRHQLLPKLEKIFLVWSFTMEYIELSQLELKMNEYLAYIQDWRSHHQYDFCIQACQALLDNRRIVEIKANKRGEIHSLQAQCRNAISAPIATDLLHWNTFKKAEQDLNLFITENKSSAALPATKSFTQPVRQKLQDEIKTCVALLGKPPAMFTIIGMGSLTLQLLTSRSDLDIAILLPEQKTDSNLHQHLYWKQLLQLLNIRIMALSGAYLTLDPGDLEHMGDPMQEQEEKKLLKKEISYLLLNTVKHWQKNLAPTANGSKDIFFVFRQSLYRPMMLYAYNNRTECYELYLRQLQNNLKLSHPRLPPNIQTNYQRIGLQDLMLQDYDWKEIYRKLYNPKKPFINIKNDFLRPLLNWLQTVALFAGISFIDDTLPAEAVLTAALPDLLNALLEKNIVNAGFILMLTPILEQLIWMRLQLHKATQQQGEVQAGLNEEDMRDSMLKSDAKDSDDPQRKRLSSTEWRWLLQIANVIIESAYASIRFPAIKLPIEPILFPNSLKDQTLLQRITDLIALFVLLPSNDIRIYDYLKKNFQTLNPQNQQRFLIALQGQPNFTSQPSLKLLSQELTELSTASLTMGVRPKPQAQIVYWYNQLKKLTSQVSSAHYQKYAVLAWYDPVVNSWISGQLKASIYERCFNSDNRLIQNKRDEINGMRIVMPVFGSDLQLNEHKSASAEMPIMYLKFFPQMPARQLFAAAMGYQICGYGLQFTVAKMIHPLTSATYPVLISSVAGYSLRKLLPELSTLAEIKQYLAPSPRKTAQNSFALPPILHQLNPHYFNLKFFEALILRYGDGSPDNMSIEAIRDRSGSSFSRLHDHDADHLLQDKVHVETGYLNLVTYKTPGCKTVLFGMPLMKAVIPASAIDIFLNLNPSAIIDNCLNEVKQFEEQYITDTANDNSKANEYQWSRAEILKLANGQYTEQHKEKDACLLPMCFPDEQKGIARLYKRFKDLQLFLTTRRVEAKEKKIELNITPLDILHYFDTSVANCVHVLLDRVDLAPNERYAMLFDAKFVAEVEKFYQANQTIPLSVTPTVASLTTTSKFLNLRQIVGQSSDIEIKGTSDEQHLKTYTLQKKFESWQNELVVAKQSYDAIEAQEIFEEVKVGKIDRMLDILSHDYYGVIVEKILHLMSINAIYRKKDPGFMNLIQLQHIQKKYRLILGKLRDFYYPFYTLDLRFITSFESIDRKEVEIIKILLYRSGLQLRALLMDYLNPEIFLIIRIFNLNLQYLFVEYANKYIFDKNLFEFRHLLNLNNHPSLKTLKLKYYPPLPFEFIILPELEEFHILFTHYENNVRIRFHTPKLKIFIIKSFGKKISNIETHSQSLKIFKFDCMMNNYIALIKLVEDWCAIKQFSLVSDGKSVKQTQTFNYPFLIELSAFNSMLRPTTYDEMKSKRSLERWKKYDAILTKNIHRDLSILEKKELQAGLFFINETEIRLDENLSSFKIESYLEENGVLALYSMALTILFNPMLAKNHKLYLPVRLAFRKIVLLYSNTSTWHHIHTFLSSRCPRLDNFIEHPELETSFNSTYWMPIVEGILDYVNDYIKLYPNLKFLYSEGSSFWFILLGKYYSTQIIENFKILEIVLPKTLDAILEMKLSPTELVPSRSLVSILLDSLCSVSEYTSADPKKISDTLAKHLINLQEMNCVAIIECLVNFYQNYLTTAVDHFEDTSFLFQETTLLKNVISTLCYLFLNNSYDIFIKAEKLCLALINREIEHCKSFFINISNLTIHETLAEDKLEAPIYDTFAKQKYSLSTLIAIFLELLADKDETLQAGAACGSTVLLKNFIGVFDSIAKESIMKLWKHSNPIIKLAAILPLIQIVKPEFARYQQLILEELTVYLQTPALASSAYSQLIAVWVDLITIVPSFLEHLASLKTMPYVRGRRIIAEILFALAKTSFELFVAEINAISSEWLDDKDSVVAFKAAQIFCQFASAQLLTQNAAYEIRQKQANVTAIINKILLLLDHSNALIRLEVLRALFSLLQNQFQLFSYTIYKKILNMLNDAEITIQFQALEIILLILEKRPEFLSSELIQCIATIKPDPDLIMQNAWVKIVEFQYKLLDYPLDYRIQAHLTGLWFNPIQYRLQNKELNLRHFFRRKRLLKYLLAKISESPPDIQKMIIKEIARDNPFLEYALPLVDLTVAKIKDSYSALKMDDFLLNYFLQNLSRFIFYKASAEIREVLNGFIFNIFKARFSPIDLVIKFLNRFSFKESSWTSCFVILTCYSYFHKYSGWEIEICRCNDAFINALIMQHEEPNHIRRLINKQLLFSLFIFYKNIALHKSLKWLEQVLDVTLLRTENNWAIHFHMLLDWLELLYDEPIIKAATVRILNTHENITLAKLPYFTLATQENYNFLLEFIAYKIQKKNYSFLKRPDALLSVLMLFIASSISQLKLSALYLCTILNTLYPTSHKNLLNDRVILSLQNDRDTLIRTCFAARFDLNVLYDGLRVCDDINEINLFKETRSQAIAMVGKKFRILIPDLTEAHALSYEAHCRAYFSCVKFLQKYPELVLTYTELFNRNIEDNLNVTIKEAWLHIIYFQPILCQNLFSFLSHSDWQIRLRSLELITVLINRIFFLETELITKLLSTLVGLWEDASYYVALAALTAWSLLITKNFEHFTIGSQSVFLEILLRKLVHPVLRNAAAEALISLIHISYLKDGKINHSIFNSFVNRIFNYQFYLIYNVSRGFRETQKKVLFKNAFFLYPAAIEICLRVTKLCPEIVFFAITLLASENRYFRYAMAKICILALDIKPELVNSEIISALINFLIKEEYLSIISKEIIELFPMLTQRQPKLLTAELIFSVLNLLQKQTKNLELPSLFGFKLATLKVFYKLYSQHRCSQYATLDEFIASFNESSHHHDQNSLDTASGKATDFNSATTNSQDSAQSFSFSAGMSLNFNAQSKNSAMHADAITRLSASQHDFKQYQKNTIHFLSDHKRRLVLREVAAKANGNCLFECFFKGLQIIRPLALKVLDMRNFSALRIHIAKKLADYAEIKTTQGTFREVVIQTLSDLIKSGEEPFGFPETFKAWISDLGKQYRDRVAERVVLREYYIQSLLVKLAFPKYLDAIQRDRTWGCDIEMRVVCEFFKVKIVVYNQPNTKPIAILGDTFSDTIYLYHRDDGTHYHLLVPVKTHVKDWHASLWGKRSPSFHLLPSKAIHDNSFPDAITRKNSF